LNNWQNSNNFFASRLESNNKETTHLAQEETALAVGPAKAELQSRQLEEDQHSNLADLHTEQRSEEEEVHLMEEPHSEEDQHSNLADLHTEQRSEEEVHLMEEPHSEEDHSEEDQHSNLADLHTEQEPVEEVARKLLTKNNDKEKKKK
jgi:hypothetical protein